MIAQGFFLLVLLLSAGAALADDADARVKQPAGTSADTGSAAKKPDTAQGPTVIRRRFTLINEYTRLPDQDYRFRVLPQLTWSFGAKRDYGLSVEVPYAQYRLGGAGTGEDASGLGDIRTFFIHPFRADGKWVHAWALESYFNTAAEPQLGAGSTTLLPSYALTYRQSKEAQYILLTQYQFDVRRDDGVPHVSQLALRPFAILSFPNYWYSFLEGKVTVDFARDDKVAVTFNPSFGRFLGEKRKVSAFAVVGLPLNSTAREVVQKYQFKLGMNYFF